MKAATNIVINILFLVLIYCGLFLGHEGATNIGVFWAWVISVVTIIGYLMGSADQLKGRSRSIPAWLSHTFDLIALLAFLYYGYIWLSVFYASHVIAQMNIFEGSPIEVKTDE